MEKWARYAVLIAAQIQDIIKQKEPGRNERVMLQGPNGEMQFVKYKNANQWISKGYQLM